MPPSIGPTATVRKLNPVVAQHKPAQRTHISYVKRKYDKKAVWQQQRHIRRTLRSVRWPHRTSCGLPDVAEAHPEPSCRPRAPPPSSSCPGNRNSRFKVRGQFNVYIMTSYQTPTYLPHRCRCPTPQLSSPPVHTMSEVGETALSSHSHRQTCPQQRTVTILGARSG